jgi:hypothetical protein
MGHIVLISRPLLFIVTKGSNVLTKLLARVRGRAIGLAYSASHNSAMSSGFMIGFWLCDSVWVASSG